MSQRYQRLSAYRIMWIFVQFDLPTGTKRERKKASVFRKRLLKNGFQMFQFSTYIRHCSSRENAAVHIERIYKILPDTGHVCLFTITDKQFGRIQIFDRRKEKTEIPESQQLTLF